jgi:hypothetical protein
MPGHTLSDALTDFASAPPARSFAAAPEIVQELPQVQPPAIEQPDIDELLAAEAERVRLEVTEKLNAEHEVALEAERQRHAEEMSALSSRFGADAAGMIEKRFGEVETRLVALTSSVTARILGACLSDEIRERSLASLADKIRAALADNEAVRIRVRGTPALCEAIELSLGGHADQVDFGVADGFDLSVTIDDSIFETRLTEWSAAMAEIFE